jgi:uncharacterized protein
MMCYDIDEEGFQMSSHLNKDSFANKAQTTRLRYHMSKKSDPRDNERKKTTSLHVFFSCMLALGLLMATTLFSGGVTQYAQGQNNTETTPQTQDPEDIMQNTQTMIQTNDTNLDDRNYPHHPYLSLANLSTVSTSGTATTKVWPDKFSVTVGVDTNATTAQEAVSLNANLTAQVIAALRGLGVNEDQIETSNYSVYPIYESRPPLEACIEIYPPPPGCEPIQEIVGYRASNSITVTLDVEGNLDVGQIIDTAIEAGANNVNGVLFFLSPELQREIRDSLIRDAIANALQRANIAAEALEMTITGVESVHLDDVYFPIFSLGLREAAVAEADTISSPTPILPGQQEVSTMVNIIFYISEDGSS